MDLEKGVFMGSFPITTEGYQKVLVEMKQLKKVERPAIIIKIAEARSHGDLKENAEYHAARERQSFIEGRIGYLNGVIADAEIIDLSKIGGEKIVFGATVTLLDLDTDEEVKYQLVGEIESDPKNGLISVATPIARSLIGKSVGDDTKVVTPAGTREYEILKVEYV